ncbi:MAG: adenine phosphoribosyltransferase [Lysobacterales bacterium]|jgi:adenine phosphoribosyltransferase
MSELTVAEDLKKYIRDIVDFPKEGIVFKDITTLLSDSKAFKLAIDAMVLEFKNKNIEYVVGVEARGFLFGAVVAYLLDAGFVPVRKAGKLPYKRQSVTYDLEYGTDTVEIHEDAMPEGARVLVVDDLLATGGTIKAVADLVAAQKANIISLAFLVELEFLNGKDRLTGYDTFTVLKY